jgi:flagellar biosynthesis chaperone FliJ
VIDKMHTFLETVITRAKSGVESAERDYNEASKRLQVAQHILWSASRELREFEKEHNS